jgi:Dyp-type peroxidase family
MAEFAAAELEDMQGTILSGYAHLRYATYLFLEIADARAAGDWLARITPEVATAAPWEVLPDGRRRKPQTTLSIGLTFAGLKKLGLPADALNTFEREFIEGIASRARILGDTGDSAPEHWEVGGPTTAEVHVLLVLNAPDEAVLGSNRDRLRTLLQATGGGVNEVNEQHGHRPSSSKEPFGFLDGISQPFIERSPRHPGANEWVVQTGEFVLGYLNGYNEYPLSPGVPTDCDVDDLLPPFPEGGIAGWKDLGRHGTFMVYRKLAQDVAGFWNTMAANAARDSSGAPDTADMVRLAAKCVGRWPSGAPLTLTSDKDDPALGRDAQRNNNFLYQATDEAGLRCPLGAHVRRANPRDSRIYEDPQEAVITSNRHRILRRAVSFGNDLFPRDDVELGRIPRDLHDDGEERGIHFLAINASIRRQFELIQTTWCNSGSFNGLFNDKDPIIGNNDGAGRMTIQSPAIRRTVLHIPRLVRPRGGGYFFLPSLTALRFLARFPRQRAGTPGT